jgi:hypothetical protein
MRNLDNCLTTNKLPRLKSKALQALDRPEEPQVITAEISNGDCVTIRRVTQSVETYVDVVVRHVFFATDGSQWFFFSTLAKTGDATDPFAMAEHEQMPVSAENIVQSLERQLPIPQEVLRLHLDQRPLVYDPTQELPEFPVHPLSFVLTPRTL